MAKTPTRRPRTPSRPNQRPLHFQIWGSSSTSAPDCRKFLYNGHPIPVGLSLQLDAPVVGGNEFGCEQLCRPTLLIHAQDPAFACCWFSRAIDLGDESGNPAFWMLEKTAKDTWSLCLRRVSGQVAAYDHKSKGNGFPIKLKKGKTTNDFKWPATITVGPQG